MELDACLTGLGGRWNHLVYKPDLGKQYHDLTIVHLEMLNLLVAIRQWGDHWASQKVMLNCNNQAVVSVRTNGRTRDRTLAAIARNIKMQAPVLNINLITRLIFRKKNPITDLLWRWNITSDPICKLHQLLSRYTFIHVPHFYQNIDYFIYSNID